MTRRKARASYPPDPRDPNFKQWLYQFWNQITKAGNVLISQLSTSEITANQVLAADGGNLSVVGKTVSGTTPITVTHSNAAITLAHANSGVTAGLYGNAVTIPQFNVNAGGHLLSASNVPISLPVGQISTAGITANQVLASATDNSAVVGKTIAATTPIEVTHTNASITLTHANSGATAGVYGNAVTIPQVNISTTGHVQSVSNVAVNLPVTQLVPGSANQLVRVATDGSAVGWVDFVAGTNITLTQNAGNIAVAAGATTLQLISHNAGGLPSASPAGQLIYVPDESGGAVPAFSDGSDWRRVTDRAVVT